MNNKARNGWRLAAGAALFVFALVAAQLWATTTTNSVFQPVAKQGLDFPAFGDVLWLDDANSNTYTLPTNAEFAMLSPVDMTGNTSATVWCRGDAAGALPAADIVDGSASVPITGPAIFQVSDLTTIRCIRTGSNTIAVYIATYSYRFQ